jgi:hypothetical protein
MDKEFAAFLKGEWISAEEVSEGDTFEILGAGVIDDESFDSVYLNIPVKYKDDKRKLRVGRENGRKIAEIYGTDREAWIGKSIRVAAIKEYKGLGQKGMLLRGVEDVKSMKELVE